MKEKSAGNACLGFLLGFIIVSIVVGSLVFTSNEPQGMDIIEIGIPIILPSGLLGGLLVAVLFYLFTGSKGSSPPKVQNWRAFLQAQPFICDKCGNFTDTQREYCEGCGARNSMRKATKKDFRMRSR